MKLWMLCLYYISSDNYSKFIQYLHRKQVIVIVHHFGFVFLASKELSKVRTNKALSIRSFLTFEIFERSTSISQSVQHCRNLDAFNTVEISVLLNLRTLQNRWRRRITRIRILQFRVFKPSNAQSVQSFDSSCAFKTLEWKSFRHVEIGF